MWDDSLPAYTGSLEDNIILFTLYFKTFVYYLVIIFAIITSLVVCLLPIFGYFANYKSIVIKLKKDKKDKHNHKKTHKEKQQEQDAYLNFLDKTIKKKKKKK